MLAPLRAGCTTVAVALLSLGLLAGPQRAATQTECGDWLCEGHHAGGGQRPSPPPLWATHRANESEAEYCDIPVLVSGSNRSAEWLRSLAWAERPFVVRGGVDLEPTLRAWAKPKILQLARRIQLKANWGRSDTIARNAGEGPNNGTMEEFLAEYMHRGEGEEGEGLLDRPYVFQKFGGKGFELPPELRWLPWRTSFFMVGAEGSGVGWHRHHAAAQLPVFGRKRWLLLPPSAPPAGGGIGFWPLFEWLRIVLPTVAGTDRAPLECIARPGDTVYVPENWYHAVVNAGGDSVAVSLQHDRRHTQATKQLVATAMDRASPAAAKIEALRGLLEIEPADIDSRYSLSALLLQNGGTQDVPAAVAELDRIVNDDHFHFNAMFLLFGALGGTQRPGASKAPGPAGADGALAPALLERLRRFEPGRNR
jgi:hypothetical protein